MYKYCAILRDAYYLSFTRNNIKESYSRSNIWLFAPEKLLNTASPKDWNDLRTLVSPEKLFEILEAKQIEVLEGILGRNVSILHTGFIDKRRDEFSPAMRH